MIFLSFGSMAVAVFVVCSLTTDSGLVLLIFLTRCLDKNNLILVVSHCTCTRFFGLPV